MKKVLNKLILEVVGLLYLGLFRKKLTTPSLEVLIKQNI